MIRKIVGDSLVFLICVCLLTACATSKNVLYFQDITPDSQVQLIEKEAITIKPGDRLSIMVYGDNPSLASIFNLVTSNQYGYVAGNYSHTSNNNTSVYTVDVNGEVKIPVLGPVRIAGLTREEVSSLVERQLKEKDLLKNPVVHVSFRDLFVYVLGEVRNPQRVEFVKDNMTILELISQCSDMTITGKRNNIKIIREIDGNMKEICIDVRSAESIYSSPAYYLLPNDLVYIEPVHRKANESTVNANTILSPSFWISVATFVTSTTMLIVSSTK